MLSIAVMGVWSIIALEGYCMFSHSRKKTFTPYKLVDFEKMKFVKEKPIKNTLYNPTPRPDFCKKEFPGRKERIPNFKCLDKKCPHFAYVEYTGEGDDD
jgi:hypothetical protein